MQGKEIISISTSKEIISREFYQPAHLKRYLANPKLSGRDGLKMMYRDTARNWLDATEEHDQQVIP